MYAILNYNPQLRPYTEELTRRVTHFQLITRCYKLTTVPKTGRGFQSKDIGNRRDNEDYPPQNIVQ